MNKSFLIITLLGPLFIIAVTFLPTYLMNKGETKDYNIQVITNHEQTINQLIPIFESMKINLTIYENDESVIKSKLINKEIDSYLVFKRNIDTGKIDDFRIVALDLIDFKITNNIEYVIGDELVKRNMISKGYDPVEINKLIKKPTLSIEKLNKSGDEDSQSFLSVYMTGIVFTLFLYMTILLYGQSIGRSVIKEKTAKTVEIILSSVNSNQLMFGKILGQGLASIVQYAVWIGLSSIALKFLKKTNIADFVSGYNSETVIYLLVFYILGFFLYSAFYSAIGSASEDEQNMGQLSYPLIIFLMVPMIGISYFITNTSSPVTVFFSMFPMTSPIIMFIRIITSAPSFIEILISILILVISVIGVTLLSGKIFRTGILMSGKKFTFKDMIQWLKQ